ncbi:MAG: hypothetical protein WDO74_01945 [Pseudomonadota bacterium]
MATFNHSRVSSLIVGAIYSCACSGGAQGEGERSAEIYAASSPVELMCAASEEQVIDLGSLDPAQPEPSRAYALNEHGTVVGHARLQVAPELTALHAFRWKAGTGMVDLGTLGGAYSSAYDVNEAEQVVGTAELPNQDSHAVVWDAEGRIRDLGTFGGRSSFARGINNRGQVVGVADDATGTRGFIWDAKSGMVDLGLTDQAIPIAINDFGVVVGSWAGRPFKWTKEEGAILLDPLGGTSGVVYAVNNLEEAVGYVTLGNESFGVKWMACGGSRLARLPNGKESLPVAINDRGLMVGTDSPPRSRLPPPGSKNVAVQWESTKRIAALPLEATASSASDVSDCGDVVGYRRIPGHDWRAYLWHPQRQSQ